MQTVSKPEITCVLCTVRRIVLLLPLTYTAVFSLRACTVAACTDIVDSSESRSFRVDAFSFNLTLLVREQLAALAGVTFFRKC